MRRKTISPDVPKSLEEAMLEARRKARAEAPPIVYARTLSQLRIREVFGDLSRFTDSDKLNKKPK